MSQLKDNIGLIHSAVKVVLPRVPPGVCYDDLFQEASAAFVQAERCFKKNRGAKFSTYVSRSMVNALNLFVDKSRHQANFEVKVEGGESGEDFESVVGRIKSEGQMIDPSQLIEMTDSYRSKRAQLSPFAQRVLTMMVEPSDALRMRLQSIENTRSHYPTLNAILELLGPRVNNPDLIERTKREILELRR